jgi:PAS domain S-box-containing protein
MVTFVINSLMNTIVMAVYWRQNKKYFNGISFWVLALGMQTIGFLLIGIRGALPDFITVVVSNCIIVSGSLVLYEGFKRFIGYKEKNMHNYILLSVYFMLQYYFTFVDPSTSIRIILISIVTSVIFYQAGRLLLNKKKNSIRSITKITGFVCYAYILVQMYRAAVELIMPTSDYFNASFFATLGQVFNQFLTIAIVFSLIVMCNSLNLFNRIVSEEKAIASKERIEDLYNNAPCGYHSIDQNGLFIDMNATELEWLGYERSEVIGKLKFTDIATPQSIELFMEKYQEFINKGFQNDIRVELITKIGTTLPVIINAKAVYNSNCDYLYSLATIFNRIEIDRIEKELEESREKADYANAAKSDFLSKISHELRTPLNSVIVLSGVLGRSLSGKIPEEERSYLEVIERSGKHLLEMINDILDISRIESGRVELEVHQVDLNDMLLKMMDIMKPLADMKNIELTYRGSDIKDSIMSDEQKLIHILQNLVSNAIKFTEKGHVEISVTEKASSVSIAVSDTGIGIEESSLVHIFEEFAQADNTVSRKFGGTGLGLSIAKKNAELLSGNITVKSTVGQGSVFTVEIPKKSSCT